MNILFFIAKKCNIYIFFYYKVNWSFIVLQYKNNMNNCYNIIQSKMYCLECIIIIDSQPGEYSQFTRGRWKTMRFVYIYNILCHNISWGYDKSKSNFNEKSLKYLNTNYYKPKSQK